MGEVNKEYWDTMVRAFTKERDIYQLSHGLARLIEYYAAQWDEEKFYVCERILEHIKKQTSEKNSK